MPAQELEEKRHGKAKEDRVGLGDRGAAGAERDAAQARRLGASLLARAVVWMLSWAPLWVPPPLIADPPWPMERQLRRWTTALLRLKFEWFFRSDALGCSFSRENLGAAGRLGADERSLLPRVDLLRGSSPSPALRR